MEINVDKEKIIQQIKQLEEKQVQAILKSDIDALKTVWSEELHVNNPFNMVVNREQVIQNIKSTLIEYSEYKQESEYYGIFDDVVIVMGKETAIPIGDNPNKGKKLIRRYTDVYKLINGEWKEIARHANVVGELK
jgi:hypothetical protein